MPNSKNAVANQKRVPLNWLRKDFENEILPAIRRSGMPVAGFIKTAVREKIKNENLASDKNEGSYDVFPVCAISRNCSVKLIKVRNMTDEEKILFPEWNGDVPFISESIIITLKGLTPEDVSILLNNRDYDGSFASPVKNAYIITEEQWNKLAEMNNK